MSNIPNESKHEKRRKPRFLSWFTLGVVLFAAMSFLFDGVISSGNEVSYSNFLKLVESGNVASAEIDDTEIQFKLRSDGDAAKVEEILASENNGAVLGNRVGGKYVTGPMEDPKLVETLTANNVDFTRTILRSNPLLSIIISLLPFLIIMGIYFLMIRSTMRKSGGDSGVGGMMGGIGNVGKSKAKMYSVEEQTGVTFKDVAGQDEAKESLMEMVDYLHDPEKYARIGAKQPKGALLVGPPGTGKTLLAKAVAGEAKVPFFHLSGSEFVEMFVGVGASRVRDLFQNATKNAPCIIFIDEIDAIGKRRDSGLGGNDEREQTLNQLLSEMDGFESGKGILVLAATNRPEILDQALLRPGRFDRRVIVDRPDLPGRKSILKVHAAKVLVSSDVDFDAIALATSGATGADLANMINEAALHAVKEGHPAITHSDLMEAVEVVIAGKEKKGRILNPREKRMVAFHEVGHAMASALQTHAQPVQKITIVPRTMGALGYTMNAPEEERYLLTRSELQGQIVTLLGGRAAEIVEFGDISTGASNDIERATSLARKMITQYGMSEKFGSMGLESTESQYLDGRNVSTCSEQTGAMVDEEVRQLIDKCQKEAVKLLEDNREALTRISEYLIEKENLTGEQFMELLEQDGNAA
ncbi:cell division protease FtsH [Aequitasia blattaphilus]|uniref:ATP-dependent zinc metalloprotease FtsH n=1 Tax=Aequitasia blattaphilus TaxID=2949332 RepID=A0ABT1E567_9FIRM|nr:ATP-dependent zinc metalloprotease FtsH [Aequitasia blattaphilus]MCP1100975.1 ATP-dependent zinc metalloprotease FtsH [Aequitasia blattaphilus]MCR8613615.1 ATP-dependent zinc metalloprotease FtsH [Aequitasia blattaphilus]